MVGQWHRHGRWWQIGASVLLSCGAVLGVGVAPARAGNDVFLRFRDINATVPITDLQTFASAEDAPASEELQGFLSQIPLNSEGTPVVTAEDLREILSEQIRDAGISVGRSDQEFIAIQLSRSLGDQFGRERRDDMIRAVRASLEGDRSMTFLEILENYPDNVVRLDVSRAIRLRNDVEIFVERLTPLFLVLEELLPELVCDCGFEDEPLTAQSVDVGLSATGLSAKNEQASAQVCRTERNPKQAELEQTLAQIKAAIADLSTDSPEASSMGDGAIATSNPQDYSQVFAQARPDPVSQRVVFAFGPFRPSFEIADLEQFVETGRIPTGWRFYVRLANINLEDFRTVLTSEVSVQEDLRTMDQRLNSFLGEYLLFQVSRVIRTPSRDANIQALRAAMILSASDDGKYSLLEVLRYYPAEEIWVEGLNLARFAFRLDRQGAVGTATSGLEDFLLEWQYSIADEICDCEAEEE